MTERIIASIQPTNFMGILSESPKEWCEKREKTGPATYRAWSSRHDRFYIAGVASTRYGRDDDITITLRHPHTKDILLGPLPGVAFNPEDASYRGSKDLRFVPTHARHEPGNIEPVYCTEQEPLIIEAEGTVPLELVVLGSDYYSVWTHPECGGPFPEFLGIFRQPFVVKEGV